MKKGTFEWPQICFFGAYISAIKNTKPHKQRCHTVDEFYIFIKKSCGYLSNQLKFLGT